MPISTSVGHEMIVETRIPFEPWIADEETGRSRDGEPDPTQFEPYRESTNPKPNALSYISIVPVDVPKRTARAAVVGGDLRTETLEHDTSYDAVSGEFHSTHRFTLKEGLPRRARLEVVLFRSWNTPNARTVVMTVDGTALLIE